MVPPEKLKPTTPCSQVEHSTTGWLYRYNTAIQPLYHHVVCDIPVSCKANGDRYQLWAWLDSDQKPINNSSTVFESVINVSLFVGLVQ